VQSVLFQSRFEEEEGVSFSVDYCEEGDLSVGVSIFSEDCEKGGVSSVRTVKEEEYRQCGL
jgi:hypothetical protein